MAATKTHPPWPRWRLQPCGTEAAYRRHLRRGEPADVACKEAAARAAQARKQVRRQQANIWTLMKGQQL